MNTPYDLAVMASRPVGYWPLDETSGTSARDRTSNANHGTYVNTPTLGQSLGFTAGDVGPTFDAASSEHVTIPNHAAYQFAFGDYSEECVFYRAGDPVTEEQLIGRGSVGAGGNGFELYLGDAGAYATSRLGTATVNTAVPGWTWGGTWHHLVIAMDRDGLGRMYVDGAPSGTVQALAGQAGENIAENAITYLGRSPGGTKYLTGGLAKVALYDRVLAAGEVAAHWAARVAAALPAGWNLGMGF